MTQATLMNLLNNQNNGLFLNTRGNQNLLKNNVQPLQTVNNPTGQQTIFTNTQPTNPTLNVQSLLPYTDSNGRITYPVSNLNNPSPLINPRLNLNTNNNQLLNQGRQSVNQVTPDYQSTELYANPSSNANSLNQQLLNSNLQRYYKIKPFLFLNLYPISLIHSRFFRGLFLLSKIKPIETQSNHKSNC